jgi:hypothetical protein
MKLPASLNDLTISMADGSRAESIRAEAGVPDVRAEVFVVESVGAAGYVIALVAFGQEDQGGYAEPSPLLSGHWNGPGWRMPEPLGART